jgi:hypothetical protein
MQASEVMEMSQMVRISPQVFRLLERRAQQEHRSPDQVVERLLREHLHPQVEGAPVHLPDIVREALGLSQEEWQQLQKGLPSAREIGDRIGSLLPPGTSLSAEIVAMRDQWSTTTR